MSDRSTYFLLVCAALLLATCGTPRTTPTAELSFKKLVANAEMAVGTGNYRQAADDYRRAYSLRPGRRDLLFESAELSRRIRDYRAAAETYQFLESDVENYPLVGLYYGRALRQDGRPELAREVLTRFRQRYNGADRSIVAEIARNELAGIELALRDGGAAAVNFSRPGRGINTSVNEYGPVAIAGDQLLFTSNSGGQARLYQSQLRGQEWTKATVPPGFPVIAEGEFGTGSLSTDGRVFYFTICSGLTGTDASNRCEIFRGERSLGGNWAQPVRLSSAVNQNGSNNAYPGVATVNGRELLFFASDREGGRGGMDLYLTSRAVDGPVDAFTPPANLGPAINTVGDEITPCYLSESQLLYFASNGHPGFGGLDIFSSQGAEVIWSPPRNLGRPVNSVADDYGLSTRGDGGLSYLTSNRRYPDVKDNTTETDIFSLNLSTTRARLKATVYDNTTGAELSGAEISLLQREADGSYREIARKVFPTGTYDFDLLPGRQYRVVIRRQGYRRAEYAVQTEENSTALYGQPVFLRPGVDPEVPVTPPAPAPAPPGPSTALPPPATQPTTPAVTAPPPPPVVETVPETAYRIQISAERRFDPNDGKYAAIRDLGNLTSEAHPTQNLRRVTVGYFTDPAVARGALRTVQQRGFPTAFAVRYDRGQRHGRVNLR